MACMVQTLYNAREESLFIMFISVRLLCLLSGETVDEAFMTACHFIKDRQAEIETPDKEMVSFQLFTGS